MKSFKTQILGLALTGLILGACSQTGTYETADLMNEQALADKAGFKMTPFGNPNGENVRYFCGVETTKTMRKLNGNLAVGGSVVISNDQTDLYIEITPAEGIIPTGYSYFIGNQTTVVNNGGLNGILADHLSVTGSFTIALSDIADVYGDTPLIKEFDLGIMIQTADDRYWADGAKFTSVNANQGSQIKYVVQTDCPTTSVCYGDEGAWGNGTQYNGTQGSWASYSSYEGLKGGVILIAGNGIDAGDVALEDNEDGTVSITITLSSPWMFGDEGLDENGVLIPGSVFVQPFSQADVDSGSIPKTNPQSGNPMLGNFEFKFNDLTGYTYTIPSLPKNDYYGIKTSVQKVVECPL